MTFCLLSNISIITNKPTIKTNPIINEIISSMMAFFSFWNSEKLAVTYTGRSLNLNRIGIITFTLTGLPLCLPG